MASAPADIQTLMRQLNGRPCQPAKPIDHEATERLRKSREHYTAVAMRRGLKLSDPVIDAVNYAASLEMRNRGYAVKSTGLAWVGGLGCGKTLAATYLAYCYRTLAKFGQEECKMVEAANLAQTFASKGEAGFWDFTKRLECAPLIIDDLGAERDLRSYGNASPLADWLLQRYARWQRGGPELHITTNLTSTQLADRYGQRFVDRLVEMCAIKVYADHSSLRRIAAKESQNA